MEEQRPPFKIKRRRTQKQKNTNKKSSFTIERSIRQYLREKKRQERQNRPASLRALDETMSEGSLLSSYEQSSYSFSQDLSEQSQESIKNNQYKKFKYQEDCRSQCSNRLISTKSSSRQSQRYSQEIKQTPAEGSTTQIQIQKIQILNQNVDQSQNKQQDPQQIQQNQNNIFQQQIKQEKPLQQQLQISQNTQKGFQTNLDLQQQQKSNNSSISQRFDNLSRIGNDRNKLLLNKDIDEEYALELQQEFQLEEKLFQKNSCEDNNTNNVKNNKLYNNLASSRQEKREQIKVNECICRSCHESHKKKIQQSQNQKDKQKYVSQNIKKTKQKVTSLHEKLQSKSEFEKMKKYLSQQTKINFKERQELKSKLLLFTQDQKLIRNQNQNCCKNCLSKCPIDKNKKQIKSSEDFRQIEDLFKVQDQSQIEQYLQSMSHQSYDFSNAQTQILLTSGQALSSQGTSNRNKSFNASLNELIPNISKDPEKTQIEKKEQTLFLNIQQQTSLNQQKQQIS